VDDAYLPIVDGFNNDLHASGGIVEERAEGDAVYITGRVPYALRDLVAPYILEV